MTTLTDPRERLNTLAQERAGHGYMSFLDFVIVDAQPRKRLFPHIAEWWQWERAKRIAGAIEHLSGHRDDYAGPRWFWNGYHKGSDKTHEDARELL